MIREITITPVLNGFVCKVGCQKVVFQSPSELARAVERYYKNPDETEKEFLAGAVNKMNDGPCAVAEPPRVFVRHAIRRRSVRFADKYFEMVTADAFTAKLHLVVLLILQAAPNS